MSVNPYLFNIKTAQSYLDTINKSASDASTHFEEYAAQGKLDRFCELASFDMFLAASLGLQLNATSGKGEGLEFAEKIIGALSTMTQVSAQCPYSKYDMLKFNSWDTFVEHWNTARDSSQELIQRALQDDTNDTKSIMKGFLNDKDISVSDEEATEMSLILTFAASDTTSSLINNVLTNLSRNPHVQDLVRQELKDELGGSDYNTDAKLTYFGQVLKETQRLTPPLAWVNVKSKIPTDIVLGGYHVPKGTTIVFSHMGIANNEEYAGSDPTEFRPERYSKEAVASRKGTKAEFLDHPLCTKPFGFGARMCVGSRVAKLEYSSLLCRLLQDYKIECKSQEPGIRLSHTTTIEYPCPKFQITKL